MKGDIVELLEEIKTICKWLDDDKFEPDKVMCHTSQIRTKIAVFLSERKESIEGFKKNVKSIRLTGGYRGQ